MKNLLTLLPVVWLCSCAGESGRKVSWEGIGPEINAPQTLEMLGESYQAAYSTNDSMSSLVEYYRPGEGQKSWAKMLTLRLSLVNVTGLRQVESMESSMKAGGASAVRSFKGKNRNECGIEFTVMSHGTVELDVFRFVNRPNGMGTISLQYAEKIPFEQLRAVGEANVPDYYAGIRAKAVKGLEAMPMPVIEKVAKPE
jgi:hypothetical protein